MSLDPESAPQSDTPNAVDVARPRCPRCAYDLAGALERRTASEVSGVCSECGLQFAWEDVLDPARADVAGFVEHAPGTVKQLVRSSWRTAGWILMPTLFWARVRLERRVVPWRWAIWAIALVLPLHALASLLGSARILLLSTAWLSGGGGLRGTTGTPGGPNATGQTLWILGSWLYPVVRVDPWNARLAPTLPGWTLMLGSYPLWVWGVLGVHLLYWVQMLTLSHTRRGSGVRSAHIHRAFVYGLWWIAALALFRAARNALLVGEMVLTPASRGRLGFTLFRITDLNEFAIGLPLLTWTVLWWLVAMKVGWRLRAAWVIWSVLSIASTLAGVAAIAWAQKLDWVR